MNIVLLSAAGFIGTNLTLKLAENKKNQILAVDAKKDYFRYIEEKQLENVSILESEFNLETDFETILQGQEVVFHLVSSTVPTTSNQKIALELEQNVVVTARLLDACVKTNIKKVVFLSSGGTVYGKNGRYPLNEASPTYPICSYGIQKITIEKLLYLYNYLHGLDYRVIRLANPYGPYQRPNGILGAVTTFTYKALRSESIEIFGDGSVVRDFIYIDDAVNAILNVTFGNSKYKIFNLGCGYGTSISKLLDTIQKSLHVKLNINYYPARDVDVPVNYLDISRYEHEYNTLDPIALCDGIKKTALFLQTMNY